VKDEFQGHALALTLLGNYLQYATTDHDIRRWREVSLLEEDAEEGGHAGRVLSAYERWLDPRESSVLRLLGIFRRPAEKQLSRRSTGKTGLFQASLTQLLACH